MPELIEKRTRNSKTHSLGGNKYAWDGTIGSIHYEDNGWQEIDNIFEPALAPWDWQMLKAGYHIRVKEDFTAGQIIEFEKQGETVQFQPMALEWTNDLDQIQPISMPANVTPAITNPEVDLLPVVGMPSHQGTIRWGDAYGEGVNFEWRCSSTRLVKILGIENLNKLPVPEQYIIDGGNPVLRLNLIFDPSKDTDIYVDGELWDKKAKKQTFKVIEFRKGGEVLWGFMPLRYWDSSGENEGQSVATLEKRGGSLYISIRVPYQWLQSAVYPVFIDTNVDEVVGASADDAEEAIQIDNSVSIDATSIRLGHLGTGRDCGFRFQTVAIPNGATIDTAYIQHYSNAVDSGSVSITWYGEDIDDAPAFVATDFNISGRDKTAASVNENPPEDWSNNTWEPQTSIEIKTLIKEIVDRPGWATGQDMVIISAWISGTGERSSDSWDGDSTKSAKLHIGYTAGAPQTLEPAPVAVASSVQAPVIAKTNQYLKPSSLAVASSVQSPSISGSGVAPLTTNPVQVAASVVAPVISTIAEQTLEPAPVAVTASVQAPSISGSGATTLEPSPVAVASSVQSPSISGSGATTLEPSPVAIQASVQAPVLVGSGAAPLTISPVAIASSVQSPSIAGSGVAPLTPDPVAVASSIQAPTLLGTGVAYLVISSVAVISSVQAPVIANVTIQAFEPSPVAIIATVQAPEISLVGEALVLMVITAQYRKLNTITAQNRLVKVFNAQYRKIKAITSGG